MVRRVFIIFVCKGVSKLKILTWNVNGCRARLKAGLENTLKEIQPDVFCMQETRAKPDQLSPIFLEKYQSYFSIHKNPGYAGSSIFLSQSMPPPLLFKDDFPEGDETGRVSICDFKYFKLINAYVPNAGSQLEKIRYRIEWQEKLKDYISKQLKPVIYCGDLNCAHKSIDVGSPTIKNGVSFQERNAFQDVLDLGLVDAWRYFNPEKIEYTWFSNQSKSRTRGMRLDSFIVSEELLPLITNIEIIQDEKLAAGSDHSPVLLEINLGV